MYAETASSSMVIERSAAQAAPTGGTATTVAAVPRPTGLRALRRWFARTFDFRDAFTPTSAW